MNTSNNNLYIGLLTGTSIDGIDASIFYINNDEVTNKGSISYPIEDDLKNTLNNIIKSGNVNLIDLGETNRKLGLEFAKAVKTLLKKYNYMSKDITAIGLHGQTILHHPNKKYNFSMQIGDPNTVAELTNIAVVTDFRQRDMVHSGQGAPLAPLFHQTFMRSESINRAVVNIGGISNLTVIPSNSDNNNFNVASDLGPGNTLLDQWFTTNNQSNIGYDKDGEYAKSGKLLVGLLDIMLSDLYINKSWPKSTGREYFNLTWLNKQLDLYNSLTPLCPKDVQRTLLELSAAIISNAIKAYNRITIKELYLCGGGVYNTFLVSRLKDLMSEIKIDTTEQFGIQPEWVEAATFAWLAYCNINNKKSNLTYITGATSTKILLGCLYL